MASTCYLSSSLRINMIVVTGAAGFIGSCLISDLNKEGYNDIVAVDRFDDPSKDHNLKGKITIKTLTPEKLFPWLDENGSEVIAIYHLGAITDTTATSIELFDLYNLNYSRKVWECAARDDIRLIYASSAATYGNGSQGYSDDHEMVHSLQPLNAYAQSKHQFDLWALEQTDQPTHWVGLKFFNVFGPNEYHKEKMASIIFQGFNQIRSNGKVRLFQSHVNSVGHGEQKRDFIYVKDVTRFCIQLLNNRQITGLLNVGSGAAASFNTVTSIVFKLLNMPETIEYIEMPISIRSRYQNFTEADLTKTRALGVEMSEYSLEESLAEYVERYLLKRRYH